MVSIPRQMTADIQRPKSEEADPDAAVQCFAAPAIGSAAWNRLPGRRSMSVFQTIRKQPSARRTAGILAPRTPNDARTSTGNGMPYFVPGMRIQQHRNQHDQVAEQNRSDRLPPAHASRNESRRKHVSRDANAHRHPQRSIVIEAPGSGPRVSARGLRCRATYRARSRSLPRPAPRRSSQVLSSSNSSE